MMDALSNSVAALAVFFLHASLKAMLVLAMVLLVQKLCGRLLSAQGRYLLWLPVLISMVTPWGFTIEVSTPFLFSASSTAAAPMLAEDPPDAPTAAEAQAFAELSEDLPPTSDRAPRASTVSASFPAWLSALHYVWLAGVVAVMTATAWTSCRFASLVRQATPVPAALQSLLDDCRQQTACSTPVTALQSPRILVPMVAGLFKPVLLLPEDISARLTGQQLRHVMLHELMHLKRLDIVSNWIGALLQALHWFNPLVWLAFALMRHDRELACDAATVARLVPADRAAYGHTLLQLSETLPRTALPATALGILDNPSQLRQRILMLVQDSRSPVVQTTIATLLVTILCAAAFSQPVPATPPPPPRVESPPAVPAPAGGYLGVDTNALSLEAGRESFGVDIQGLLINAVTPGSPADRAGLKVNDVIIGVGGNRIAFSDEFDRAEANRAISMIRSVPAGQLVAIDVFRNGEELHIPTILGVGGPNYSGVKPIEDAVVPDTIPAPAAEAPPAVGIPAASTAPEAPETLAAPPAPAVDAALETPTVTEPLAEPVIQQPILVAATEIAETPSTGPVLTVDAASIQQFTDDIDAVKADKLRYVMEWNATAAECEARKQKLFGSVSKPCRKVVMALARGEVFNFTYDCYELSSRHEELLTALRANAVSTDADLERALADSERELAAFCSKETYQNEYPAFAALYADAVSLRYYDPRQPRRGVHLPPHDGNWSELPAPGSFPPGMVDYGQNGNFSNFIALPATP